VLPMYLDGTYEALPKGAMFPKLAPLAVRIGPVLEVDALKRHTRGMARSDSYRHVTRLAEKAVRALKDKQAFALSESQPAVEAAPPKGRGGRA